MKIKMKERNGTKKRESGREEKHIERRSYIATVNEFINIKF